MDQLADNILILDDGKVIAYGKKEELFQTYCGNAIFILENEERNSRLSEGFVHLAAPGHLIALSGRSREEEEKIISLLIEHNVNFKRSNCDIEIMFINAKESYYNRQTAEK